MHAIFSQYCDKRIRTEYPEISGKGKGKSVYSAVEVLSDKVEVVTKEATTCNWKVHMDKPAVSVTINFYAQFLILSLCGLIFPSQ